MLQLYIVRDIENFDHLKIMINDKHFLNLKDFKEYKFSQLKEFFIIKAFWNLILNKILFKQLFLIVNYYFYNQFYYILIHYIF